MYKIFHWTGKIVPKLPRRLHLVIAVIIGTLAWGLARRYRSGVTANVAQVLGLSSRRTLAGRIRAQLAVRRIFCSCFRNYLDLLAFPALNGQQVAAQMDVRGTEHLKEALSYGRGVILFSAHLGPFYYLTSWFPAHGYEMVVPSERIKDERFSRLMVALRRQHGVDFLPLDGIRAIRKMFDTLRRNQIVLITADRDVQGESVVMDFFGAAAPMPQGPVDLSLRTGAPLVGAFGWWTSNGRVAAEFTPLTLALPEDQRNERDVLQALLVRQLEKVVRAHLDQWVVLRPVWGAADSTKPVQPHARRVKD